MRPLVLTFREPCVFEFVKLLRVNFWRKSVLIFYGILHRRTFPDIFECFSHSFHSPNERCQLESDLTDWCTAHRQQFRERKSYQLESEPRAQCVASLLLYAALKTSKTKAVHLKIPTHLPLVDGVTFRSPRLPIWAKGHRAPARLGLLLRCWTHRADRVIGLMLHVGSVLADAWQFRSHLLQRGFVVFVAFGFLCGFFCLWFSGSVLLSVFVLFLVSFASLHALALCIAHKQQSR